jgi:acyl-phosphate glycerol 3-phosphate acyltransferase
MLTVYSISALILAYLCGSIPTAVWIGLAFYGVDVREYGSGNAGATNTFRVLGKKAGIPVMLIDILKGWNDTCYTSARRVVMRRRIHCGSSNYQVCIIKLNSCRFYLPYRRNIYISEQ